MSTRSEVLKILADGQFHSGTELGQTLGLSRAAIHKAIKALAEASIEIHRVSGRGYRLPEPCQLLDDIQILLHADNTIKADQLHILQEVDSTNQFLMQMARQQGVSGHVCISECQHQGRGRRGRKWQTTPYNNITLSVAWQFVNGTAAMTGLSLAAGVAIADAVSEYGIEGTGLKWPNDLVWQEDSENAPILKLGGILVDIQGEADGPAMAILGIGLNVRILQATAEDIDQPWVDLSTISGSSVDRSRLSGLIIRHVLHMLIRFEEEGFSPFRRHWQSKHLYSGKQVRLIHAERELHGKVLGIDQFGGLQLEQLSGERLTIHAGEISLRGNDELVS